MRLCEGYTGKEEKLGPGRMPRIVLCARGHPWMSAQGPLRGLGIWKGALPALACNLDTTVTS